MVTGKEQVNSLNLRDKDASKKQLTKKRILKIVLEVMNRLRIRFKEVQHDSINDFIRKSNKK